MQNERDIALGQQRPDGGEGGIVEGALSTDEGEYLKGDET